MENFEPKESGEGGAGSILLYETLRVACFPGGVRLRSVQEEQGAGGKFLSSDQCPIPKTQLLLYLVPIIGFFPSLWTLYRGQGSREQLAISRLSITLALTWLLGYLLLATGAANSDFFPLRLFVLNSFLTSGYFLVSVWLILRLMQGKPGRLTGFSTLAERVLGKYLS